MDGIKKGDSAFRDINSWNDFNKYLIREVGMSTTEAKKLRDYYENLYSDVNIFNRLFNRMRENMKASVYGTNKYTPTNQVK